MTLGKKVLMVGAAILSAAVTSQAAPMAIGSTSGGRSAEADFSLSGGVLTVTLINTGGAAMNNADTLTALLFNLPSGVSLTTSSANFHTGSGWVPGYGTAASVGLGWVYQTGVTDVWGRSSGISASGLGGVFGNTGWFTAPGAPPLNGIDYGLVDGVGVGTHIPLNQGPLASNAIDFTLNVTGNIDLQTLANSAVFVWGTSQTEGSGGPGVPDGGTTALMLGAALSGLGLVSRRLKA